MGQYGRAAVYATKCFLQGKFSTLRDAWDFAVAQHSDKISSQVKACPREAYLALCDAGLVKGVVARNGGIPTNTVNGQYAVEAYRLLKENPNLASDKEALWDAIPDRTATYENGQLDVLLMMYAAGQLK
jgi:hypothetical protein